MSHTSTTIYAGLAIRAADIFELPLSENPAVRMRLAQFLRAMNDGDDLGAMRFLRMAIQENRSNA